MIRNLLVPEFLVGNIVPVIYMMAVTVILTAYTCARYIVARGEQIYVEAVVLTMADFYLLFQILP